MGRTASASQRLILDLEFLRLAPACVTSWKRKRKTALPTRSGKTLNSDVPICPNASSRQPSQVRNGANSGTAHVLGSYPESASGDSAQALWELSERVQRFLDHSWFAPDEDLEPLLSSIRANSGGQLLAAAALQSRYLEHANDVLRSASKEGIYCRNEAITEAGAITKTVVAKYFAADVQRWSAQVSQRHYEIQSALIALESHLTSTLPPRYWTGY